MKKKSKKNNIIDIVKAARKKSREEEIHLHGKTSHVQKIIPSKKTYNRKNNKFKY